MNSDTRKCSNCASKAAYVIAVLGAILVVVFIDRELKKYTQAPPIAAFRQHGVKMALATDSNPGSSPLTSPLLAMNMGATLFRLTVDECLAGFTREAVLRSYMEGTYERQDMVAFGLLRGELTR